MLPRRQQVDVFYKMIKMMFNQLICRVEEEEEEDKEDKDRQVVDQVAKVRQEVDQVVKVHLEEDQVAKAKDHLKGKVVKDNKNLEEARKVAVQKI